MKFKVGDKVRFLNEKGEGTVTKIINKNTVGVTIEDGFEIPYVVTELVTIFDSTSPVPQPKSVEIAQEPQVTYITSVSERKETPKGIYLALSPENPKDISRTDFNLWLINHTLLDAMYSISVFKGKGYELVDRGEVKPYESRLIETITKKNIDLFNTVKIDLIFFSTKPFEHEAPVSEVVKIKVFKLYKENAFQENGLLPEKAMIINISDLEKDLYFDKPVSANQDLSKLLFQKNKPEPVKTSKPHKINNATFDMEIDLHIEELIDNYGGMSNAEIVLVQLRHFQKALDKAINEHYRSLTVIHGVGNGRLKQEVRAILSQMRLRFHDASYSKYGFGATEILIS